MHSNAEYPAGQPSPPRAVRTYDTVQAAIDFIAACIETNSAIQLLAEVYGVSQQVGRSKAVVDRFKSVFAQLQAVHQDHDLRLLYADAAFPVEEDRYQLGGYLIRHNDLAVEFVRLDQGWVLERVDFL